MKKCPVTDKDVAKAIIGLKKSGANEKVIEAGINYLLRRFSVPRHLQKTGQDLHHNKPVQSIVKEVMGVNRNSEKTIEKIVEQSHGIKSCTESEHQSLHQANKSNIGT